MQTTNNNLPAAAGSSVSSKGSVSGMRAAGEPLLMNTNENGALTVREHIDNQSAENGGETFEQLVETHADLREQVEALTIKDEYGAGREVWAADEIPFAVALEVVKRRFIEGIREIQKRNHKAGRISLAIQNWPYSTDGFDIDFFAGGYGCDNHIAKSIDEAISKVEPKQAETAKKIAHLRAELALLESEASK